MSLNIQQTYAGKVLLITGTTGFLGKVVLEKFLRSLSSMKKIYVLIRPKSGISTKERMMKEVFQSPCFNNVREQHPDFLSFLDSKVEAVEGDISDDRLIFNEEKRKEIQETCHFIINNAASVDFNLRLDHAIQINFYGPRRLMKLAKECKLLEAFTHVSTCYANCNKLGAYVEETIYEIDEDPDKVMEDLQQMPTQDLLAATDKVIQPWPNTYTFTKYHSERSIRKHQGNLPILLLRPSVIIASKREPVPGWTDSLAAAGGLTTMIALGVLSYVDVPSHTRADLIPVDYVSNQIILGTAWQVGQRELNVIQAGTSQLNQTKWLTYAKQIEAYFSKQPLEQMVRVPKIVPVSSRAAAERYMYLTTVLPNRMMLKWATLTRNHEAIKKCQKNEKGTSKVINVLELFRFFFTNDWCFESKNILKILSLLSPEEQQEFECNPKLINWVHLSDLMFYGISKFIFKADVAEPHGTVSQLIPKHRRVIADYYRVFLQKGVQIRSFDLRSLFEQAIFSERVQMEVKSLSMTTEGQKRVHSQIQEYLKDFETCISQKTVMSVFLLLHKIARNLFEQIIVNDEELKNLKTIQKTTKKTVILLPTFKSIIDFALLSYIHARYGVDLPFVNGLKEFDEIAVISRIMRRCGGYFINTDNLSTHLYQTLLEELLGQMMKKRLMLGYHLERKRERSGKLKPSQEFIFDNYINAIVHKLDELEDVLLVPVTINYDKVYEGEQFPYELLGEQKPKESLFKIIKSFLFVREKQGRVIVKYCKPMSFKEMLANFCTSNAIPPAQARDLLIQESTNDDSAKNQFIHFIQSEILLTLSDNLITTVTSMVSAVVLESRKQGIKEDELKERVGWLFHEIKRRGGLMSCTIPPTPSLIKMSLSNLKNFLLNQKSMGGLVKVGTAMKDLMMLSYYRNNLVHLFANECFIVVALLSFGSDYSGKLGVLKKRVLDQTLFLVDMIGDEFIMREKITSEQIFDKYLKKLSKSQLITTETKEDGQVFLKLEKQGSFHARFFASLVTPFIEGYWATFLYMSHLDRPLKVDVNFLMCNVQTLADSLFDEAYLTCYECCSLETIGNALDKLQQRGFLEKQEMPGGKGKGNIDPFYSFEPEEMTRKGLQSLFERMSFFMAENKTNSGIFKLEDYVQKVTASFSRKNSQVIGKL